MKGIRVGDAGRDARRTKRIAEAEKHMPAHVSPPEFVERSSLSLPPSPPRHPRPFSQKLKSVLST